MTGSAVGPYRLVKTRRPIPPVASSSMHSSSSNRSATRPASAPGSGELGPLEEPRSASSSGMAPTLATLSGGSTRAWQATGDGSWRKFGEHPRDGEPCELSRLVILGDMTGLLCDVPAGQAR